MKSPEAHSLVKALRVVPGFQSLGDAELLAIVGESANLFYPAGSVIFEQGAPSDGLYVVLSGRVKISGEDEDAPGVGPGEFFGELGMLLGVARTRACHALADSELMVVPTESFHRLVASSPELERHLQQRVAELIPESAETSGRT